MLRLNISVSCHEILPPKSLPSYTVYSSITILLIYCMQQSPSWEANRFSTSQEISRLLWIPEVYYCIHKCSPPVPVLSNIDLVNASHLPSRTSIVISFHLCLGFPSGLFPLGYPTKTLFKPLPPIRVTCPAHIMHLGLISRSVLCEQYITSVQSMIINFTGIQTSFEVWH